MLGKWCIVEMDLWDLDALELMGPGFIELNEGGTGSFRFLAVEGSMDVRSPAEGTVRDAEFSFDGVDECDPTSGPLGTRDAGRRTDLEHGKPVQKATEGPGRG